MPVNRGQVKANVQGNLIELNYHFYSDDDLNQSIQDAYDDTAILSQCIQKKVTLNWISNLNYYNLANIVPDYLGTIAIFNNVTNQWLRDDLSLKDFDRIRRDWETWIGTPLWWAPSDPQNIAIAAKYHDSNIQYGAFDGASFSGAYSLNNAGLNSLGTFILYYWAIAPTLVSDSDNLLIASDKGTAIARYATADLLEQAQEFNKAQTYWGPYYQDIDEYADRVKRNNKADLLLRL